MSQRPRQRCASIGRMRPFARLASPRSLGAVAVGALLAAGAVFASTSAGAAPALPGTPTLPGAAACPVFPADNVWNTDISKLPVDPHSTAWLHSMHASTAFLHPDF